jgi:hypothetical protein
VFKGSDVVFSQTVPESNVSDYIGKDAAKKLNDANVVESPTSPPTKEIEGEDLKVGGQWATNLYDRTVPNFLNKYGKKWGAKVEPVDLSGNVVSDRIKSPDHWMRKNIALNQLSIPITPEMRESVMGEGQPMFQKTKATPEQAIEAAKAAVKPRSKEAADLLYKVRSIRSKLIGVPKELVAERVSLELQLEKLKTRSADFVRQRIYDYAKAAGLQGVPYNRVDTLLKNSKTEADFRRAIRVMDSKVKGLGEKAQHRSAKEDLVKTLKSAPKRLRPEYQEKWQAIVDEIQLSKPSEKTKARLIQLERLLSEGLEVPERVSDGLKRLRQTAVADMTVEETQEVTKSLKTILRLNELKGKLWARRKWRDYGKTLQEARGEIDKVLKDKPARRTTKPEKKPGLASKIVSATVGVDAETPETIIQKVAGEGAMHEVLYGGIDKAKTDFLTHKDEMRDDTRRALEGIDIEKLSPVIGSEKKAYRTIKLSDGEFELSPGQMISIYMHSLNPHNLNGITGNRVYWDTDIDGPGLRLNEKDIGIVAKLVETDPDLLRVAQQFGKVLDGKAKELINERSRDLDGYEIASVDRYWRLMRKDLYRDFITGKGGEIRQMVAASLEGVGAFKERNVAATGSVVVEDAFKQFYGSVQLAAAYNAYAAPLRAAKQLLNDMEYDFRRKGNLEEHRALKQYVTDIEGATARLAQTKAEKFAGELVGKAATSALGVNPIVMLRQVGSFPFAITEIEPGYLAQAMADLVKQSDEIDQQIDRWSPQLRERREGGSLNIELGTRAASNAVGRFFGKGNSIIDIQTAGIRNFDSRVIRAIWKAVDLKVSKETKLEGDEKMQAVAEIAEKVVRRTQPTYDTKDRSAVARSKQLSIRLATSFTSVTNKILQMYKTELSRYSQGEKTAKDKERLGRNLTAVYLSSSLLMAAVDSLRDKLFGRKTDGLDWVARIMRYSLTPIYFAGPAIGVVEDVIGYAKKGYWSNFNSDRASENLLTSMTSQVAEGVENITRGIAEDKPIQTGNFERLGKGLADLTDVFLRARFGLAIQNIVKYAGQAPVEMYKRVFGDDAETEAKKAGYRYRVPTKYSQTVLGEKQTVYIKQSARNRYQALAEAQAQRYYDANRERYKKMNDEEKKEFWKTAYQQWRSYATESGSVRSMDWSRIVRGDEVAFTRDEKAGD